jgi:hypothetical protein
MVAGPQILDGQRGIRESYKIDTTTFNRNSGNQIRLFIQTGAMNNLIYSKTVTVVPTDL